MKRNLKRWRGGQMVLRWTAAAVLETVTSFRRLKRHKDMPTLVAALRARDQQRGITVQWRTWRRISCHLEDQIIEPRGRVKMEWAK